VTHAPAEAVWKLLLDPASYPQWAGAEVRSVEPPGEVRSGSRLVLSPRGFGFWWRVVFEVGEVRPERLLQLTVRLPYGIVNEEAVTLAPLPDGGTRVTFN
jgi:uncharacterized protein YndB with AHSA1/START domain